MALFAVFIFLPSSSSSFFFFILQRVCKADIVGCAETGPGAPLIYRAFEHCKAVQRDIIEALQKGQLSMAGLRAMNTFPVEISYKGLKYSFEVSRNSAGRATINHMNVVNNAFPINTLLSTIDS
jgi:hypothetical protein